MRRLAIIPARGGSKRIPRKNEKEFCGVPVIAYSIRAALASGCFDEVMVSTDDESIARVAAGWGAEVPFMRSAATANDYATTADVIREVLDEYAVRGKQFDIFACIYATAPFITPDRLRDGMRMIENGEAASAFTCVEYSYPIQRSLRINEEGRMEMRFPKYATARSQDLEKTYHDAGQFYLCRTDTFLREGTLWGSDTRPIILSELEVQDLDTLQDWRIAEMKYRLLSFPGEIEADGFRFISYPRMDQTLTTWMLAGRNEEDVRRWMVNTEPISKEDHERFIETLRTRRDKQYYAVTDSEGAMLGSVNLEWTRPGEIERGIWMFADARGKGYARRLLKALYAKMREERGVERVLTKVKIDNEASQALEHSLGAREESRDGEYIRYVLDL